MTQTDLLAKAPPRLRPPHFYKAFGMVISSELELPELEPHAPAPCELTIRRGRLDRALPEGRTCFQFGADEQYLGWPALGHFLIRSNGSEVIAEPGPDIEDRFLNLALLGPVMATLLQLRGFLILHGSAIDMDGSAVVFLGDKEAGKSTTAAAFSAAGRQLLTDDVVAVDLAAPGGPRVVPGYPQMKLSAAAVGVFDTLEASALPKPHPAFEKERLRLRGPFPCEPLKLAAAYVLSRGAAANVTALSPVEGMKALMRFSYSTRFSDGLIRGPAAIEHMRQCAGVADAVSVCVLETPSSLLRLGEVVDCVAGHVRG